MAHITTVWWEYTEMHICTASVLSCLWPLSLSILLSFAAETGLALLCLLSTSAQRPSLQNTWTLLQPPSFAPCFFFEISQGRLKLPLCSSESQFFTTIQKLIWDGELVIEKDCVCALDGSFLFVPYMESYLYEVHLHVDSAISTVSSVTLILKRGQWEQAWNHTNDTVLYQWHPVQKGMRAYVCTCARAHTEKHTIQFSDISDTRRACNQTGILRSLWQLLRG